MANESRFIRKRVIAGQGGTDADAALGKAAKKRRERKGEKRGAEAGNGGKQPGRTGAYGADPSGASANVSVSVSAGRTRVRTGRYHPGSYRPHLSRHTSPPLPASRSCRPSLLPAGPSATLSRPADARPSTQVFRQTVFASCQSGGFRWGSLTSGTKKRGIGRGTRCTIGHRVSGYEEAVACSHDDIDTNSDSH